LHFDRTVYARVARASSVRYAAPRPYAGGPWPRNHFPTEALERQARRLLEQARERTGASVERMVKTFGELQPRGAVTRRSWYDWQERPETVSLLTGLAAMHALGREASMELVFGEAAGVGAGVDAATKDARIDQLQSTVEDAMTSSCSCASASRASSSPSSSAKASRSRPSWPI
jgi:hypothetical protein